MTISLVISLSFLHIIAVQATPPCPLGTPIVSDPVMIEATLARWNSTLSDMSTIKTDAEWDWSTNLTDHNQAIMNEKGAEYAELQKSIWSEAICINCSGVCSDIAARTVRYHQTIDTAALPSDIFDEYTYITSTMTDIYSNAKVCRPNGGECLPMDPDLRNIMTNSRDYCELRWAWEGWRNATGQKLRGYFTGYAHLQNEAARLNGFKNAKEVWTKSFWYDEPEYFEQMEEAWQTMKPLYQQLHAFVRKRLRNLYKDVQFPESGHIPAHLLGDQYGLDWYPLMDLLLPDRNALAVNITDLLLAENLTVTDIYYMADDFFQSLGMDPMTDDFWQNSIFEKPEDVDMDCQGSAWDFYRWSDFRIKICSEVSERFFEVAHHEMGHVQYFMHYRAQPIEFREGANPGFHEAIGDLIALSVMTPDHLKAVGLLPSDTVVSEGTYLNSLMSMALKKLAFLPFGYLVDKYRWDVFEKKISFRDLNAGWWHYRCDMQGLAPPVPRSEQDFDPGAKYHVPASVPYDRYFFSYIAQFQFHLSICRQMGYTSNFHRCDIFGNVTALQKLREAMKLGQSLPYPQVLKMITGTDRLDASDIVAYFKPLQTFLEKENEGEVIGWTDTCNPPEYFCDYASLTATTSDQKKKR